MRKSNNFTENNEYFVKTRLDFRCAICYYEFMGKITEMSVQKHNKSRVNIYIDGEFVGGLEAVTALGAGLRVGAEADGATVLALQAESDGEAAFVKATDYLSRRMRTERELRDYLTGKDFSESVIDGVIRKLKEYGYIDDEGFVEAYTETYSSRRGKKRIRMDLLRHGATPDLIEAAVNGIGDQREAAERAAEKYLRTRAYDRRKLASHLMSKGFEWDDIDHAVRVFGGKEEE